VIAVIALVIGYLIVQRRTRKHTLRFANLELLEKVAPKRPSRVRHVPFAVIATALLILVVALAGPTANTKVPRNRATVMLAIDVSLSMESTDVAPDRLTAAKQAATAFVKDLTPGVNLGLISFAGIATVLVSPTTERQPVLDAISGLKLDERTATGEAIISALQTIENFSKTLGAADGEKVPARIVMMTDGKQTVGRSGTDAAAQAKAQGVPISMIAFGTDHGTINLNGTVQPVPLDTSAMKEIAQISGGDFHTAHTGDELRSVYAQLGEQIGYTTERKDVSRPWMIAGTIVLLIGTGLALSVTGRIP
jgi:Ca-activated chloride channel family protein